MLHDPAVAQRDGFVGHRGQRRVVRDDHQRALVAAADVDEQFDDLLAGGAVEVAGRLVGQQHRRVVGERAGDRDALLFAAREL